MRIELSSGAWVECRDKLKGRDKTETQRAIQFTIVDGQEQKVGADVQLSMHEAFLGQIITEWSFLESNGWPIPANNPGGIGILGELDIDDYNDLMAGTDELFKKVRPERGDKTPN